MLDYTRFLRGGVMYTALGCSLGARAGLCPLRGEKQNEMTTTFAEIDPVSVHYGYQSI